MSDLAFDCPECAHNLIVDEQAVGLVIACPECGTQVRVPETGDDSTADVAAESTADPAPAPEMQAGGLEYRVVGMIDGPGIDEKITPEVVEFRLNELVQEGWILRSATTVLTRDENNKQRQELLLILERQS